MNVMYNTMRAVILMGYLGQLITAIHTIKLGLIIIKIIGIKCQKNNINSKIVYKIGNQL